MTRPFHELLHPDDAIGSIRAWASAAPHHVEVLPCPPEAGQRTLEALQVTTRSPLGALAYHTGGVLVDHGWLRILGAGCDRLPRALDSWNGLETGTRRFDRGLLFGDDVLGGYFAWFDEPRSIHYFGPDRLQWEDLQLGYTDWLASMLSDRLAPFYAALRCDAWEREVTALLPEQAIHVYPPLVMRADGPRSRRAVPADELWHVHMQLGRELNGLPRRGVAVLPRDMSFSDAGYQARILAARPAWLDDVRVHRIASVSTCTSEDPAEEWARNALGWFDTADAARAACPVRPTPIVIHGYRLLDVAWQDGQAHPSTLPRTSTSPTPPGWTLLGYGVVSRDLTESFECSPLSCNHRSVDFPVNADCLLPDLAAAVAAAEDFSRGDNAEPSAYYVVEVWSEPSGGG